ncbi:type II/IV secretion system protein [Sphingobacterium olei]|uniref:Type II/IV secretion system protein n=1 Tax=Sphingobacterium olei TaxID=2571155 RepID=A0A4U0N9Q3_9SPHI|nr:GspE/PulE family protein [Sphingobacterium olei]TJZ50560.1 type II/IV secretion system protein [Sphingobacterium olei]
MSITVPYIDSAIANRIPRALARHYRIAAIGLDQDKLVLCTDAVLTGPLEEELNMVLDMPYELQQVESEILDTYLQKYYFEETQGASAVTKVLAFNADFLDRLIMEAKQLKSSDIHIESFETKGRIRIRIDGMMVERYTLSKTDYPALINKIKIQSNMDIAEKRLPQDGRINYTQGKEQFDIRVSVLPTLHGEKVVLRLLNNNAGDVFLDKLGMSADDYANYLHGIKKPNGIVLISGPTGSGKTTTLYATLKHLNKETTNILTIEDPIEYTLEGINQVQLRENIGLTFGAALRTFLRQDPDIIMVGEIRDPDTANMAIRAALTGHLVLSTIHTNSAWGTVSRLMDMGIPGFLIANTLNTTVAQRLVRLLCPNCKEEQPIEKGLYPKQFIPYYAVDRHAVPKGCAACYYTGYKGRKAVYEIIPLDQDLAMEVKKGNMQVEELLRERQIKTLGENAFDLFANQETSIEEIYPLLFNY